MDVKCAFMNGDMNEEIYIQKPKEIREMIGNFNKNFLSVGNIGQLRMKPTRYIEGLSKKLLQGGNLFLLTSCNQ